MDKHKSQAPPCLRVGDPIDPGTAAKVIDVTDFALPGEMGLKFERYYMSRGLHGFGGRGWTDNLDFELRAVCLATGDPSCTIATFMRPDGSQLTFKQSYAAAPAASLVGPFTEVGGGQLAKLTYSPNGSGPGTYTLTDEDGMTYVWTQDLVTFPGNKGILAAIKDPSGIGWTITHPNNTTTVVTHTSGRHMVLSITPGPNGGVSALTVTDPGGNQYVYEGESGNTLTWDLIPLQLASVELPGSKPVTIQYVYSLFDSSAPLSGKGLTEVDYNGVAHDLTAYDTNGNAVSTSLADGTQNTSLHYGGNSTGAVVTITNPLGHVSVYQYNANALPISVTGQASAHCAATLAQMSYDANGNMQSEVDNNGNTTHYTYAATGQLLQTVKAWGTPIARTTNYVWDNTPSTDRLLSVTVVGWSQTSYTYNAQNRLATVSIKNLSAEGTANQTLTTRYGYTLYANGMVKTMTVTHPSPGNSDVDTYQYDALGNLTSVADGLGHATSYSNYNGLGEPGHVVGPNGDTTDFTYDGRGLVLTRTTHPNGTTAQWVYTYDQFGMVSKITAPDGEVATWNRNSVGVLQSITHNDKDGASTETFSYNANGDVTSDKVTRNGTVSLANNVSYDELGRPYRQQGMHGQSLTYTYDGNGNVHSTANAMGHAETYTYDALNRVSQTTESGGASPAIPSAAPSVSAPATSNTGSYTVSWTGVTQAASYTLQQRIDSGAWQTVESTTSTTWGAVGKSDGTYGYRVQACNSSGCGPWSGIASVVVALVPMSAPSLSVPTGSSTGSYVASWNSVATATRYVLQEQVNGGAWATLQSSAATSLSIGGRHSGSYGYRVQACNNNGCGPWSGTGTVTVLLPPQNAPSLSVPALSTNGAYAVSWGSVGLATSYTLQERINNGGWATVRSSSATSWSTSGRANASYGYRVQACNGSGCGPWSGTGTVVVKAVPQAPSVSVPASNSSGAFTASWTAAAYATSYTLQEQVNGGSWTSVYTGASRSWSTSGRIAGTYGYRARACDTYGCSGWSAVHAVTVSVPISANGHSYTSVTYFPPAGNPLVLGAGSTAGNIGIRIANGTTWQVYSDGPLGTRTIASGAIPAAAAKVRFTWTYVGVPSGSIDGQGAVGNGASSPVAVSSNPSSQYLTKIWSGPTTQAGRTYRVKVDFFNATGTNISSSTCTLTAEVEAP